MARVTVEDCLKKINNRFDLVMVAAKRAHQLNSGTHTSLLDVGKDKAAVIALREIAEGLIDSSILTNNSSTDYYGITKLEEAEAEFKNIILDKESDELSEVIEK